MTTLAIILAIALCGAVAAALLYRRLYLQATKAALTEARKAVLEATDTLNTELKDAAHEQAKVDAVDRGGASAVLDRLRKAGA